MDGKIYEAISNVMVDIGAIGKDSKNQSQGWKFRGIDAVMNALNPALAKHKVFCAPEVLEIIREERLTGKNNNNTLFSILKMKFKFYTTDGSSVEVVTMGEGMDYGDKSMGKAMSYAFKYACFQLFCIPTEELMEEADRTSYETTPKKESRGNKVSNDKPVEIAMDPKTEAKKRADLLALINDLDVNLKWLGGQLEIEGLKKNGVDVGTAIKSIPAGRLDFAIKVINDVAQRSKVG